MSGENDHKVKQKKSGAAVIIRVVVSAVVLFVMLHFIPLGDVWGRMKLVSPLLWLGVFAAFLGGHVLAAAKWRLMIGGEPSFPIALRAHFAGLAANLALPGVAGGDLVRAGLLMKSSTRKTSLAIGSLADRLIDSAALLAIAATGALWLGARAGVNGAGIAAAAAAVAALGVGCVVLMGPIAKFVRSRAPSGKFGALAVKLADAFEEMSERPATLVLCAALSISIQATFATLNAVIAANLGAQTTIAMWIFAWPLAKLVATLPISFGGLGVREASLAGLLTPLGVASAGVVAASLVWQTIIYAAGIFGLMVQILWRRRNLPQPAEVSHG